MAASCNIALLVAAALSAVAALLHMAIIVGGLAWYRFFGAGERFARAAAAGHWYPALVTVGIAGVLASCSVYALSGAGLLPALPLLKPALLLITLVYLLRGLVLVPALLLGKATPFLCWSSLVCLVYGATHLLGLWQVWQRLG